jgi:putative ABC transport system permease protein
MRTVLVVASIAVGVFAIGVIVGTYVILSEDLNRSYAATNPANIALMTMPFETKVVDAVHRMDSVKDAEGYREVMVRLQMGQETWETLRLVAYPDYDARKIFRLLSPQGATVPDDYEVILEHKTLKGLGVSLGDELSVELPDGTRRQLTVVGSGVDQSDIYDTIMGEYRGYISLDTLAWLRQPTSMDHLYVTVAANPEDQVRPNDKAYIQQVATEVTDRLEKSGLSVYSTELSRRDEHPLDSIIRAVLMVLIILGVLIVFLSGALIANTMSALLNQHLRQIGVMKLIGARRLQVVGMYILLIMSFGVIALLLAVPLGSWGAYALSRFAADVVNFVLQDFHVIPQAVIFQIIIGLLVPPAAGLFPVLKGSRITVQKAISTTGLGEYQKKKGWIDRQLERLRMLSRPLLISIRNTFRRKGRLMLTLFTLTLGGAIFIAVFNAQVALDEKMEQVTKYFGADVQLDFERSYRIEEITRHALNIAGVERVEVWVSTGAELIHADGSPPDTVGIIAPPANSDLVDPTLLQGPGGMSGRWLLPGDENAIAVNEAFWDDFPELKPGDSLRLKIAGREEDWTVVGIFQYTGFDDLVAYANYDYVTKVLKETKRATSYHIVTTGHSLEFQQQVSAELDTHFRDLGFKIKNVEAGKAFNTSVTELLGIVTVVLLVMALLTALVGSIGLTGTMSMNVMERTREIGVMRAIGAHNQIVAKLVIVEGLIIGLLSYGIGAVLSFPISALLSNVISIAIFNTPAPFAFTAQGFLIWLGVVVLLSVFSSLMPARNASKLTIREVLAYE